MPFSIADQIWNRAALESGGPKAREGDRALSDLILAHSMVMNGGVGHALEALSLDELVAASRGYRFFGLDSVAALIEDSILASEDEVAQADPRYWALIPSDKTLVDRFKVHYDSSPHDFAPIE